jgi:hypothetical protein
LPRRNRRCARREQEGTRLAGGATRHGRTPITPLDNLPDVARELIAEHESLEAGIRTTDVVDPELDRLRNREHHTSMVLGLDVDGNVHAAIGVAE